MSQTQPEGYLATPDPGEGDAVLVLHAWWGLNDTVKAICTRLAESGFVAFAPDLYHGQVTDKIADAEKLSEALFGNLNQAKADTEDAANFLIERAGSAGRGLSVIGFSLGAYFALELSDTAPEHIRSVVLFYGTRPGDYRSSKAAFLGHFAAKDEFEPQSSIDDLDNALRACSDELWHDRLYDTGSKRPEFSEFWYLVYHALLLSEPVW